MGHVDGRVAASLVGRKTCDEFRGTSDLYAEVDLHQRRARLTNDEGRSRGRGPAPATRTADHRRGTRTRTRTCTNDGHDTSDPRKPTISAAPSSLPPRSPRAVLRQRQASTLSHREAALRPTLGDPGVSAANPGCPTHSNPTASPPGEYSNPAPSSSSEHSDPDSSTEDVHVYLVTVHVQVQWPRALSWLHLVIPPESGTIPADQCE
jgi:hypothetical protein